MCPMSRGHTHLLVTPPPRVALLVHGRASELAGRLVERPSVSGGLARPRGLHGGAAFLCGASRSSAGAPRRPAQEGGHPGASGAIAGGLHREVTPLFLSD